MIDIKLIRENRDVVKENIKKKFQDEKLPLVDEIYEMDIKVREAQTKADNLKAEKNKMSGEIGKLMKDKKIDEANKVKEEIAKMADEIKELEENQTTLAAKIKEKMMVIPNIIDPSVPIGKDDTENVEVQRFGDPVVPDYEIPYHADIINNLNGMDKEAAGRTSGEGFYYLLGDVARLHEAMIAYARDFMIDKGFTYAIPPFMIHADVVTGVMSFPEMEAMMYKIEGEDLYLIGTSEHSMIGKFKDQIIDRNTLPIGTDGSIMLGITNIRSLISLSSSSLVFSNSSISLAISAILAFISLASSIFLSFISFPISPLILFLSAFRASAFV